MESKNVSLINKLSFFSLVGSLLLSVFFFVPYSSVTADASKGFLISIGVIASVFFWLIARLMDGKFLIPKDKIMLSVLSLPVMFFVASLFSSSLHTSLFSSGFEVGTFGFILTMSLIFFLSSIYFQGEKGLSVFFKFLFLGGAIAAGLQLIYVFLGNISFVAKFFSAISSGNFVGSWNDFVLFMGLMVILSIFTLEFLKLSKKYKIFLYILMAVGLVFMMIINIPFVWLLVGLFSLVVFVYSISIQNVKKGDGEKEKKLPVPSLIVMIVSVLFLIGGSLFGSLISRYVNLYNPDVRPSLSATSQIAWKAVKHNPFFGTGPNTFAIDWALWKPEVIKDTAYWNLDFVQGVGLVPTFLVTTGVLGFLAILVFMGLFLWKGVKSLKFAFGDDPSNYFMMSSFILAVYGWVAMLIYTPGILICALTFAASGVFIGVLVNKKIVPVYNISFLNDPRNSFFSILTIVVLMIVAISGVYMYTQKFVSIVYFSKGVSATDNSVESMSKSERMLLNAIALDQNDLYYRTLSQVYVAQLNYILTDKTLSEDIVKSRAQSVVASIQQSASGAVSVSPKNYQNWVNLGNVYSSLVTMGVDKAYENAVDSYSKALTFAPSNPSILLARAQLEFLKKDNESAKKYIEEALKMKKDYLDAIFMMAQIQTSEGNLPGAIKQAEYAASLYPNDPSVFFQLGLLRYNNNEFTNAVSAFETAVILNPSYFNARYFLGMSYAKIGRTADAKIQFEILNKYIPDNADVKKELDKLNNPSSADSKTVNNKNTANKNIKLPIPEKK